MILQAIRDGFRKTGAVWGLVAFLLAVNVLCAALLAVPLGSELASEFRQGAVGRNMMYGFDHDWWSRWSEGADRWSFGPDILGTGFAFKNLDLLLRGALPAGLFVVRAPGANGDDAARAGVPPVVLAAGALYLLLQVFLTGGVLGVLRAPRPSWTVRGLLHGSGFYFGRFFRLALLVLVVDGLLFAVYGPVARWVDVRAHQAVSERTAVAWLFGRSALLLLALLVVNMVASYARVIVVVEERASALLALVSSVSFCLSRLWRTLGHVLAMALLAVVLLAVWGALDARWTTTGYKTQLVTFLLLEGLVFGRLFLRLAQLGGQVYLYRRLTEPTEAVEPAAARGAA